jgi:polysaccharide export outer membrane protein
MPIVRYCRLVFWALVGICLVSPGCGHIPFIAEAPPDVPREGHKVSIAEYEINSPDIIAIDLIRAIPLPPYKVKPQDLLFIQVNGTPPEDPIKGLFRVEPEGKIRLGPAYGSVAIAGLTLEEAARDIERFLKRSLKEPQVSVSLEEIGGIQLVRGEHLVRPDGTVNLGKYGRVPVARMTQEMAKAAIEKHLSQFFLNPEIALDITGFNSSVYYLIFDGGGSQEQVSRFPYLGSETVLDAIAQVNGLPAIASKNRVWLARPEEDEKADTVLPIDWRAITMRGQTRTNYQIQPGDRIYVAADPLIRVNTYLEKAVAPVERLFGIALLGNSTILQFRSGSNGTNGFNNGFGGFGTFGR